MISLAPKSWINRYFSNNFFSSKYRFIYIAEISSKELNIILKQAISKKNLIGDLSNLGGFEINTPLLAFFWSKHGSLVKLNVSAVDIDNHGEKSKLHFKRIDSITYKMHVYFSLIFTILSLIGSYYILIFKEEGEEFWQYFALPFIGLFYLVTILLIGKYSIRSLKKKIEDFLYKKGIIIVEVNDVPE